MSCQHGWHIFCISPSRYWAFLASKDITYSLLTHIFFEIVDKVGKRTAGVGAVGGGGARVNKRQGK